MTTELSLDQLDADGALRETAAEAATDTRAGLLARAGLIGGGAFGIGALLQAGTAQAQSGNDISILNFALTLEYLEAAFYTEAVRKGALHGERRVFTRVAGGHERSHVELLRDALGRRAVKRPRFDFRDTTESTAAFTTTAIALEQTGIGAYKGQAPRIQSKEILAVALSIHSVEARHTGWIRDIAGRNPAPRGSTHHSPVPRPSRASHGRASSCPPGARYRSSSARAAHRIRRASRFATGTPAG